MTGNTGPDVERQISTLLRDEAQRLMATTDVEQQQELLETRLHDIHRRRPVYVAVAAAAAVAAVATVGVLLGTRSTSSHVVTPAAPRLPQPAATPLVVYQNGGTQSQSTTRVLSFLDTRGKWCTATLDSATAPTASDYDCRDAKLTPPAHGFGAVFGVDDAPSYDNFRSWFDGVASADVARVTVVFKDGHAVAAKVLDQGAAHGVVFSLAWPTTTSNPAYYRAYAADGHLIQQVPVKQAVIPK